MNLIMWLDEDFDHRIIRRLKNGFGRKDATKC
jgi:hypothetical protein